MSHDTQRKGYVIAVDGITDVDRFMDEYLPATGETVADHDGEVLVGSTDIDVIEGDWDHSLTVVLEFPSVEAAEEWYNDDTYQELKRVRHETCEYTDLIITSSFSPDDLD
ncbi:DUF1330 domain-containing protein [Haladaptatus sp. AB618]|uniref:DUF1330 domain-containing protein n=1 Tax=Haladaptatus sp. AB618 TaxID=2934173 RepID=UPI00209C2EB6|nr:DUF1330 domain-containing protein [Haladaptatus sp. AB618]MCO8253945.1 DUF1330 domain-containing protein [Haladaptatus sp. AB618]